MPVCQIVYNFGKIPFAIKYNNDVQFLCCVFCSGSLQISGAEQSDEGKYECVAQNSAGIAYSYPANLAVHGMCSCLLYSVVTHSVNKKV